jgi:hypothetical protein
VDCPERTTCSVVSLPIHLASSVSYNAQFLLNKKKSAQLRVALLVEAELQDLGSESSERLIPLFFFVVNVIAIFVARRDIYKGSHR